ncbi:condensation domain-containing protein [Teredinibacter purpureus]|uniref:condensation domain-containing protein n=1 Tax=Teredinibacter purpureus TaxID=2731756 RepID=UPI0005F8057C|nr:condensation domain-containing protein [Teredinibacter purpureus]
MTVQNILWDLGCKGVEISLENERIMVTDHFANLNSDDEKSIAHHEQEISELLLQRRWSYRKLPPITPRISAESGLHYKQKNWWNAVKAGTGFSGIGFKPVVSYSTINREVLQVALMKLVERHDALALCVRPGEHDTIVQYVHRWDEFDIPYYNLSDEVELTKIMERFGTTGYSATYEFVHEYTRQYRDLPTEATLLKTDKPLFRVSVIKTQDQRWEIALYTDHLISDGLSVELVRNELHTLYVNALEGIESPLKKTLPFLDYVDWHNTFYNPQSVWTLKERQFWEKYYADMISSPIPHDTDINEADETEFIHYRFSEEHSLRITAAAASAKVSEFNLLFGAVFLVLADTLDQQDLTIPTIMTGRLLPETQTIAGHFAEMVFVKSRVDSPTDAVAMAKKLGKLLLSLQLRLNVNSTDLLPLGVSSIDSRLTKHVNSTLIFSGEFYRELSSIEYEQFSLDKKLTRVKNDHNTSPKLVWVRVYKKNGVFCFSVSYSAKYHKREKMLLMTNKMDDILFCAEQNFGQQ